MRKAVWRSVVSLEEAAEIYSSAGRVSQNENLKGRLARRKTELQESVWSGDIKVEIFGLHAYYVEQKAAKDPHNK